MKREMSLLEAVMAAMCRVELTEVGRYYLTVRTTLECGQVVDSSPCPT